MGANERSINKWIIGADLESTLWSVWVDWKVSFRCWKQIAKSWIIKNEKWVYIL